MPAHRLNGHLGHTVDIGWDTQAESFALTVTNPIDGQSVRPWRNEPPVHDVDEALEKIAPYARIEDVQALRLELVSDRPSPGERSFDALCETGDLHGHVAPDRTQEIEPQPGAEITSFDNLCAREVPTTEIGADRVLETGIDR